MRLKSWGQSNGVKETGNGDAGASGTPGRGCSGEPQGQTPLKASPEGQEQRQGHSKEAAGAPRRYTREGGSRAWWRERDECQSLAEVAE